MQLFHQQKTETTKATKIVAVIGVAVILIGAFIFLFWESSPPSADMQRSPAATGEPEAKASSVGGAVSMATESSQGHYLNSSANLQEITELRSQLEVETLKVAVAEQQAKLNNLPGLGAPVGQPQIVATPQDVAAQLSPTSPQERVISIQGLGGNVTATVETAFGVRIFKVGDDFGEGERIERISLAGVEVSDGEYSRVISVEE